VQLGLQVLDGRGDALASARELVRAGLDQVELGVEGAEVGLGLLHALLESALDLEVLDLALLDVKLASNYNRNIIETKEFKTYSSLSFFVVFSMLEQHAIRPLSYQIRP